MLLYFFWSNVKRTLNTVREDIDKNMTKSEKNWERHTKAARRKFFNVAKFSFEGTSTSFIICLIFLIIYSDPTIGKSEIVISRYRNAVALVDGGVR